MNIKPLAYFSIAVALLFASCKKSDNPEKFLDLNGVYQASNTEELSALVMYTVNGKVTNQDTINAYINRTQFAKGIFNVNVSSISANNSGTRANFQNDGIAVLTDSLSNYSAKFTVTQKNATGFILEAIDTGRYLENSQPNGQPEPRSQMLAENISTIDEISNCYLVPAQTGFTMQCTVRDAFQFIIKDNKIFLFSFSYLVSCNSQNAKSGNSFTNQSGYFNTSVVKQLIVGDTIIYQTRSVLFNKK